jgi:hypothetical protein
MEVNMVSNSLPHLSPEQEFAHKFAAHELAKYCQEFSSWRKSKDGQCSLGRISAPTGYAGIASLKKPAPPGAAPIGMAKPESIANPEGWE